MSMTCDLFTTNHGMLKNRCLKVFYSPRRHEEHEVLYLRAFVVIFLTYY